jgi:MFS family permease
MSKPAIPFLRSWDPVPAEYRRNFRHLYFDTAWFGVLSASAVSFVTVYATRQGANAFQLGLLSAGAAFINLLFTLPTGRWLEGQSTDSAAFWAAAAHRFFYLLWIPLPWLASAETQIWVLIGLNLLMSIPGTVLAVSFNALFADSVPPEWRGRVVGIRNALLSVTFILVSLLCGFILDRVPFPTGYQIVFGIGVLGAAMSTAHLRFVHPPTTQAGRPRTGRSLGDMAVPGRFRAAVDGLRPSAGLRFLRNLQLRSLRPMILTGPFGRLVAVIFAFYMAVQLAIPVFPLHWVNNLHLTDREIGLGTAVFYVAVFLGSIQLGPLARRYGHHRLTAIGAILMSAYPGIMAPARGLWLYLAASFVGGLGWSLVGGSLTNYVLEQIPSDHRPAYLAWYNLALNAALLSGSLLGPLVADVVSIPGALGLFAVLRLVTALAILR